RPHRRCNQDTSPAETSATNRESAASTSRARYWATTPSAACSCFPDGPAPPPTATLTSPRRRATRSLWAPTVETFPTDKQPCSPSTNEVDPSCRANLNYRTPFSQESGTNPIIPIFPTHSSSAPASIGGNLHLCLCSHLDFIYRAR